MILRYPQPGELRWWPDMHHVERRMDPPVWLGPDQMLVQHPRLPLIGLYGAPGAAGRRSLEVAYRLDPVDRVWRVESR